MVIVAVALAGMVVAIQRGDQVSNPKGERADVQAGAERIADSVQRALQGGEPSP